MERDGYVWARGYRRGRYLAAYFPHRLLIQCSPYCPWVRETNIILGCPTLGTPHTDSKLIGPTRKAASNRDRVRIPARPGTGMLTASSMDADAVSVVNVLGRPAEIAAISASTCERASVRFYQPELDVLGFFAFFA